MLTRFGRLAALTALVGLFATSSALAGPHFSVQIGVPVVVAPAPPVYVAPPPPPPYAYGYGYGYVWQPGYYITTRFGPRWVAGAWVRRAYVPAYGRYRYARRGWR